MKRFQIREMNKNRTDYSLVIFFILILIFTVLCFILNFGDVNMNSEKIKMESFWEFAL